VVSKTIRWEQDEARTSRFRKKQSTISKVNESKPLMWSEIVLEVGALS
jgi:hypothetical protein